MLEWLGPLRAALGADLRRRAVLVLLVATSLILIATAYSSYSSLRDQRRILRQLEAGKNPVAFQTSCGPEACRFIGPGGRLLGPNIPTSEASLLQAGPTSQSEQATLNQLLQEIRPQLASAQRDYLHLVEAAYAPKSMIIQRARTLGSLWGVLPAIFLGATLFGAEWRWGLWRTHLTVDPRRLRILCAKLLALWTLVAVGFVLVLAVSAVADALFRHLEHARGIGGPDTPAILVRASRPIIGLELYATFAAGFAIFLRSSLAGLGGPLSLLLADGLLTRKLEWFRFFLPAQQVARLLPTPDQRILVNAPWWPLITNRLDCGPGGGCKVIALRPIPVAVALLVLGLWLGIAVGLQYVALRTRDVPD